MPIKMSVTFVVNLFATQKYNGFQNFLGQPFYVTDVEHSQIASSK